MAGPLRRRRQTNSHLLEEVVMRLFLTALVVGTLLLVLPGAASAMSSISGPAYMDSGSGPAPVVTVAPVDGYSETAVTPAADESSDNTLGDGAYLLIGYVSGLLVAAASYVAYRAWERRRHGTQLA
jgi:hypothetical protein